MIPKQESGILVERKSEANSDDFHDRYDSGSSITQTVIATTKYKAQDDTQLSFVEGDVIKILEMHEAGWWKGVLLKTNKTGYFPVTYTKFLPNKQIELTPFNMQPRHTIIDNKYPSKRQETVELKIDNEIIDKNATIIDAQSENYYTPLNVKYDPNNVTKYGLVSHYMAISSSIMMIFSGIMSILLWNDSTPYLRNDEIIFELKYYLYTGCYCVAVGFLAFAWEWIYGIERRVGKGLPLRSLIYLVIGAPTFWSFHTSLAGIFWLITSLFSGLAYKNGETQERIKKRKKKSDYEGEVCFRCCAIMVIEPEMLHNSLHWFEDLRNQSKIKKYSFVAAYILFNIAYIIERWYWYYNLSLAGNDAAAKGIDVDTKVFGVLPGDLLAQIKDAHDNGYVLSPVWFPIAKMFGNLLDINCAFIVLPVCRTFIRNLYNVSTDKSGRAKCFNFILSFMPLDKAIQWHKLMAFLIFVGGVIHPFAHFMNYNQVPLTYSTLFGSTVWISGTIILVCMHLMFTTSMLQVRHAKFEMFWYTHHLFIVFFIALLFHGRKSWNPNFWKWFVAPGLLYISERILREYRSSHPIGVVSVTHMNNKFAKVFCLELEKTGPIASFKEGQYIFIRVPIVSKTEWHPFTISSAPHEKTLTLHIRNMGPGSWTDRVQQFYEALSSGKPHKQFFTRKDNELTIQRKDPAGNNLISIDGPMAAPTQHLGKYKTAVIIGAGIGVTPLRATLQSIVYFRFKHGVGNTYPNNAYCIWVVNHKQIDAYKFMCRTLKEAEDELYDMRVKNKDFMATKRIKMHVYVTSVKDDFKDNINYDELKQNCGQNNSTDLQNWGPHHDNHHTKLNSDVDKIKAPFCEVEIYRNLRNPPKTEKDVTILGDIVIHRGRPKWKNLFLPLRKKYRGSKIGVMYCGPPIIANALKISCGQYSNHSTNTIFMLHKENF